MITYTEWLLQKLRAGEMTVQEFIKLSKTYASGIVATGQKKK